VCAGLGEDELELLAERVEQVCVEVGCVCGCVWVWVGACGCVWVCVCEMVRTLGETHLNCMLSASSRCVCVCVGCEQVCLCVLGVWVWV